MASVLAGGMQEAPEEDMVNQLSAFSHEALQWRDGQHPLWLFEDYDGVFKELPELSALTNTPFMVRRPRRQREIIGRRGMLERGGAWTS